MYYLSVCVNTIVFVLFHLAFLNIYYYCKLYNVYDFYIMKCSITIKVVIFDDRYRWQSYFISTHKTENISI